MQPNQEIEAIEARLAEIENEAAELRSKLAESAEGYLSPKEAAALLRVPLPTIYFHIKNGKIKASKFIGRIKINKEDLLSLVTHDSLNETGRKCYCEMARMLLTSIWARLGNRSDRVNTGGKPIYTVNRYNIISFI